MEHWRPRKGNRRTTNRKVINPLRFARVGDLLANSEHDALRTARILRSLWALSVFHFDSCCPDLRSQGLRNMPSAYPQVQAARKLEKLGHLDPGLSRSQARSMASPGDDGGLQGRRESSLAVLLGAKLAKPRPLPLVQTPDNQASIQRFSKARRDATGGRQRSPTEPEVTHGLLPSILHLSLARTSTMAFASKHAGLRRLGSASSYVLKAFRGSWDIAGLFCAGPNPRQTCLSLGESRITTVNFQSSGCYRSSSPPWSRSRVLAAGAFPCQVVPQSEPCCSLY